MPREINWTDAEEIGIQLQEKYPDIEPFKVRFTDLHKRRSRRWRRSRWLGTKSTRTRKTCKASA
jgi:hypothetical protein